MHDNGTADDDDDDDVCHMCVVKLFHQISRYAKDCVQRNGCALVFAVVWIVLSMSAEVVLPAAIGGVFQCGVYLFLGAIACACMQIPPNTSVHVASIGSGCLKSENKYNRQEYEGRMVG